MTISPPTQGIYIDFRAPHARKFWHLRPPTQGIYTDFGAPQARKFCGDILRIVELSTDNFEIVELLN